MQLRKREEKENPVHIISKSAEGYKITRQKQPEFALIYFPEEESHRMLYGDASPSLINKAIAFAKHNIKQ